MKKSIFKEYENKSSIYKQESRIVQGGKTETLSNRLGWWERDLSLLEHRVDDIIYTITEVSERKPHLVAYEIYDNSRLFWLVLQFNNIVDVNEEFVAGREIRLPSNKRVYFSLLTKSPTIDELYE